jgi:hypothetical protein
VSKPFRHGVCRRDTPCWSNRLLTFLQFPCNGRYRKDVCNRCGKPRPESEVGGGGAEPVTSSVGDSGEKQPNGELSDSAGENV